MAKFIVVHGGSRRREVEIGDETLIGRGVEADVKLAGAAVSRKHALVSRAGKDYVLRDLDSENGTYVDEGRVERVKLRNGMRVQIADYVLIFDTSPVGEEKPAGKPSRAWGRDDSTATLDIVAAVSADKVAIGADIKRLLSPEEGDRLEKRLEAMYRISQAAGSFLQINPLLDEVLSRLADVLPEAERGFVALRDEDGELRIARLVSRRGGKADDSAQDMLSATIAGHVIERREAVLCKDARADFSSASSVQAMNLGSVMCVPLALPDRVLGIMELDAPGREGCFSLDDLNLVAGIASIVSVAIEKLHLYEELRESRDRLDAENVRLRRTVGGRTSFASIVGETPAVKASISLAKRVAGSDSTILITGDSGTGKELLARAIHFASGRRTNPFVVMNCAAIPETLLETELFGIEKGVATGVKARAGKIEQAKNGTLFLDEVGDMSAQTQAKMLRVLERSEFQRVGGEKWINVGMRMVAATNKDLRREMQEGRFREDLYYRLKVVEVHLPPLRARREDIPLLVHHFLRFFAEEQKKDVRGVSDEAMQALMEYDWPGNIRELRNGIERGVVLVSPGETIEPDLLPAEVVGAARAEHPQEMGGLPEARGELEKGMIERALKKCGGNKTKAARILGISREGLRLKMKKYGIG